MQIKLVIVLAAVTVALTVLPAVAADMPAAGTKNFTAPGDAPSYFANETVPESARVANQATFTEVDDDVVPTPSFTRETVRGGRHASAGRSSKSKARSGSTQYAKASASKSTRSAATHGSGVHSTGAAKASGKSGAPTGASKASTTRAAKSNIRQNAAADPPPTAATSFS
jgi:hypothetical protein